MKNKSLISALALLSTPFVLVYFYAPSSHVIRIENRPDTTHTASSNKTDSTAIFPLNQAAQGEMQFINNMVEQLRQKHGHEIQSIAVQATMQDFRNFVLEQYPENGESIFSQIMHMAFPDYAQAIIELVANLDKYTLWYSENLVMLNDLEPLSRNGKIWKKRHEIFGELAEQIWQKELNSIEEKRQTVQQTIDALDSANDISMSERLYILQNTLNEQYAEESDTYLLNKGMIADVYFRLDSVQTDLKNMSQQERAQALADSRKQLGFTQKDIEMLAKEDAEKEQRWVKGYEYMSARDQLTQTYSGNELNTKLDELRKEYFGKQASTITAEEDSGFFRYERPRLYGSN